MQSLKKNLIVAGMLAIGAASIPAQAQITGPADQNATTVEAILAQPKDDQDVVLQGRLINKLGDEKYRFADGTGEITVEIDDDELPRDPVDADTLVELRGEVDTDDDRPPKIDVDSVRIMR